MKAHSARFHSLDFVSLLPWFECHQPLSCNCNCGNYFPFYLFDMCYVVFGKTFLSLGCITFWIVSSWMFFRRSEKPLKIWSFCHQRRYAYLSIIKSLTMVWVVVLIFFSSNSFTLLTIILVAADHLIDLHLQLSFTPCHAKTCPQKVLCGKVFVF